MILHEPPPKRKAFCEERKLWGHTRGEDFTGFGGG